MAVPVVSGFVADRQRFVHRPSRATRSTVVGDAAHQLRHEGRVAAAKFVGCWALVLLGLIVIEVAGLYVGSWIR